MRLRLTTLLLLAFVGLGSLMAVGYSFISAQYLIRGMDTVMIGDMERAVTELQKRTDSNSRSGQWGDFWYAQDWQDLPEPVQQAFGQMPEQRGLLLKQHDGRWHKGPKVIHFLMRFAVGDQDWLIARTLYRPDRDTLVSMQVKDSRQALYWLVGGSLLLLLLAGGLLYFWVSRPISRLLGWTRALQPQQLAQPTPDFGYHDLNELGETIRSSLASVNEMIEREQAFLRHTSHELRTPISVVRSNTELLHKLQGREGEAADKLRDAALGRLQRAGQTMTHLTETLLWLSREDPQELPVTEVDLAALTEQLCEEMRYLLNDKAVSLKLLTGSHRLMIPETAARIVLGNLIRNAFQHTWEGEVEIRQQGDLVEVSNCNHSSDAAGCNEADLGFGLGLQLTERLSRRLGWFYQNLVMEGNGRCARVVLAAVPGNGSETDSLHNPEPPFS